MMAPGSSQYKKTVSDVFPNSVFNCFRRLKAYSCQSQYIRDLALQFEGGRCCHDLRSCIISRQEHVLLSEAMCDKVNPERRLAAFALKS